MGATFRLQTNALLRKNAVYQRRAKWTNCCLLSAPIIFCLLLFVMQFFINRVVLTGEDLECGCKCLKCCPKNVGVPGTNMSACYEAQSHCPFTCMEKDKTKCGFRYSSFKQAVWCPIPHPDTYPPLMQLPRPEERAPQWRPDVPIFYTSKDPSLAASFGPALVPPPDIVRMVTALADYLDLPAANSSEILDVPLSADVLSQMGLLLGTSADEDNDYYKESTFVDPESAVEILLPPTYCATLGFQPAQNISFSDFLQATLSSPALQRNLTTAQRTQFLAGIARLPSELTSNASASAPPAAAGALYTANPVQVLSSIPVQCRTAYLLPNKTIEDIDKTLYCGFIESRCSGKPDVSSYSLALDFKSSSRASFSADVVFNDTGRLYSDGNGPTFTQRPNFALTQAVNSWVKWAVGSEYEAELQGLMSTPKMKSELKLDFSSLLGPLIYCWVAQMLLPTFLVQLVYEKEKRLRMMMKMHGLSDAAYWGVSYLWYFSLYVVYIIIFLIFGSAIGLNIFRVNSYGIQIIFYLLHGNCMIASAFLLSCVFTSSRTAVVAAFLYVFGTGLIGFILLDQFMAKDYQWVFFVEWVPAFSLYRGIYELSQYAFLGVYRDSSGMTFSNLSDPKNGMAATWAIFLVEWVVFMLLAWYLEQVYASGTGIRRSPLFFLDRFRRKVAAHSRASKEGDGHVVLMKGGDLEDVAAERTKVANLSDFGDYPIVVQDLGKTYPPMDGVPAKVAVRSLSLAVERGECFGLLGPNGAGKSTSINMMTGFMEPSSGTAFIAGRDIRREMSEVYKMMGVCPQHDLLWETLTGAEHLLFYGRLKGLTGEALQTAVAEGLRSVNLVAPGANKSGSYSGGMKRRLSVAISFMGDPEVVYLDEPSTGLDPASRRNLWEVVRRSKAGRGMILTTHSMEEAEMLCDRLGIFVDGQLVCIGNPKEITSRYGSYYVFSLQVPPEQEGAALTMVARMSPSNKMTYAVGGAFKFELPKSEVTLSQVFDTMQNANRHKLTVLDWGVANATLEEVFIKFARRMGITTADDGTVAVATNGSSSKH